MSDSYIQIKETRMARKRRVVDQTSILLLLICLTTFAAQTHDSTQRQTEKAVETIMQENCDLSYFAKGIKPQFRVGQTLRYKSSLKNEQSQSIEVQSIDNKYLVKGEPIPYEQTITISDYVKRVGDSCYVIKQTGTIENVLYKVDPTTMQRLSEESATSYVKNTGQILSTESKVKIRRKKSESVSTNEQSGYDELATIHFFYGYWMLSLKKDFNWECVKTGSEGELVLTYIHVKGVDRINHRDCYVVEYGKKRESTGLVTTIFWVDIKERFAVKVKRGDIQLTLIE